MTWGLLLALLLAPGPVFAAWASVGTLGTGISTTSDTTVVITTSAAAEAGNVVVLVGAKDEASTSSTDADPSECASVTDSAGGNTWVKVREWMNAQAASASNGAVVCVWTSKLTNQINSGGTITLTLSANITSKAASAWEFTIGAGNVVSVTAGTDLSDDAADPGSINLAPDSAEYLWVRGTASETDSLTAITNTTNFTVITKAVADAGAAATGMTAWGEFRIFTGTSNASDPTFVSADHASVYVALKEAPPPTCLKVLLVLGAGC